MADAPLTTASLGIALSLRHPVVHAAIAELIRQSGFHLAETTDCAAVLLTDMPAADETIPILQLGTDLPWPIHPYRLLAKLNAVLENRPRPLGRWMLDAQAQTLRDGQGQTVILTPKEVSILTYLLDAAGESVRREDLLSAVWGYEDGLDTHTLETHIYRLRRKLDDEEAKLLLTDAVGYALCVKDA